MPGWLKPEDVVAHANVGGATPGAIPIKNAAAAAESWIETEARADLDWPTDGTEAQLEAHPVPANIKLGGLMLAWRWYTRRNNPLGSLTSTTGDPIEMLREDPDIAKLLGVGSAGAFIFGSTRRRPIGPVTT